MPLSRIVLSAALAVGIIAVPSVANAENTHQTTTVVDIAARCETLPHLPGTPDPTVRQFHLDVTTPRHVSRRANAVVSGSVNYPVSTIPEVVGGIAVQAVQSGTATLHFITAGPGAGSISGSVAVPVADHPGRTIDWTIAYFGQAVVLGNVQIAETCVPTRPVVLPATKITG